LPTARRLGHRCADNGPGVVTASMPHPQHAPARPILLLGQAVAMNRWAEIGPTLFLMLFFFQIIFQIKEICLILKIHRK
jgi:hypothetical protein